MNDLDWIHVYEPAESHDHQQPEGQTDNPVTLLLLHGTGGSEVSLLELGRQLAPAANRLSVRGRSLEEGITRFFRRFTAVSYDQEHLASEADALASFVNHAASEHGFDQERVIAVGYSNGANIAVAMMARNPASVAGAVLLRPVMPLDDPPSNDLSGLKVLVLHGETDPYAAAAGALTPYLRGAGAQVEEHTVRAGHELSQEDLTLAGEWLERAINAEVGE